MSDPCASLNRRRMGAHTAAALAVSGFAVLRFYPSADSHLPICPVWRYLHLLCPGCGATRAFAALLRGHLISALHSNALFVAILPLLLGVAVLSYWRALQPEPFVWPILPPVVLYSLFGAAAIVSIVRNLPGMPR